jgi:hypothetical protein
MGGESEEEYLRCWREEGDDPSEVGADCVRGERWIL